MTTKDKRRAAAIQKRKQQRRAQMRSRRQLRFVAMAGLVGLTIIAWIGYSIYQDRQSEEIPSDQQSLGEVASFELDAGHVAGDVDYEQNPPAGGPHHNVWQNCGYYSVPLIDERATHSLEHGAVWITYQPDLPADQVDIIRGKAENQTYVLASPYPDLPAPVVVSAWGKQLQLESATAEALDAFLRTYRQGPQTLEPGAPCTGGTSATS